LLLLGRKQDKAIFKTAAPPSGSHPEPEHAALDIIRTETVLSRLPVHNLTKQDRVDIRILKTTADGQVELRWEVIYTERFGQARQLAYKVDTIVVNQKIDEAGRPLPKILRIGSMNEICTELGLAAHSGKNTKDLRRAFLQNATTFVDARIKYQANDHTKRTLEACFTRYSVVFTGETLPDGRIADAVYVIFNDPFWEVLNNAPIRPLDRAYMKQLPPTAQRFYEIISRKIFAALKNKHPYAKLSYAEYCTYAAQLRYFERQPVQNQMNAIHQPHRKSGYIAAVSYEATVDTQNQPDWIVSYTPGPKALAEFAAWNRGQTMIDPEPVETEDYPKRKIAALPISAPKPPPPPEPPPPPPIDEALLAELVKRGIGEMESRKLLARLAPGQPVLEQLEYADAVLRHPKNAIRNPQGFYIARLQDNFPVPEYFETSARRKLREEDEQRRREEFMERQALEIAYGEYRREEIDRYIAERVPAPEFAAAVKKELARLRAEPRSVRFPPQTLKEMADRAARTRLAEQIPIPLLALDEFIRRESSTPATPA